MFDNLSKNLIYMFQKGANKLLPKKLSKLFEEIYSNIVYEDIKKDYIKTIANYKKYDVKTVENFINRIDNIDRKLKCAHGIFEFYVMQAMILNLNIEGPVIELGCYKGGSTAKLSLICKLTGRKLYAFDSFEGLPPPSSIDSKHYYIPGTYKKKIVIYSEGSYAGSLQEVKNNVAKYGEIEVCEFIKGFYKDTLPKFKERPAFIFMDVDYIDSARTVIKYLWPKLLPGGFFFHMKQS